MSAGWLGEGGGNPSYAEVIADIVRGARLHYENPDSADPDLDLLLGDQSYARGLAKLAMLGDIEETGRLADLISRVAQLHANGESAAARELLVAAERRLGDQRPRSVGEQHS